MIGAIVIVIGAGKGTVTSKAHGDWWNITLMDGTKTIARHADIQGDW